MNQDFAQVRVAPFTDAKQLRLTTGRVLTRHDAEPGCELSSLAERSTVADGSDDGRGHNGAYAWDLANARAACIRSRNPFQFIIQLLNLLLNKLPLTPQPVDQVAHPRRQIGLGVFEDVRHSDLELGWCPCKHKTTFKQKRP